jgi:hypothetical protein
MRGQHPALHDRILNGWLERDDGAFLINREDARGITPSDCTGMSRTRLCAPADFCAVCHDTVRVLGFAQINRFGLMATR